MIGDSMFSGGEVKNELEKLANHKVTIENSAVGGASFHEGWVQSIPAQYASLNITEENAPITAIVDGGGNDVMSVKVSERWNRLEGAGGETTTHTHIHSRTRQPYGVTPTQ